MRATRLVSSAISRAVYDDNSRTLSLWFKDSGLYVYFDVPPDVFDGLKAASSPGRYFCDAIKGRYRCAYDPARKRFRPADAA